MTEKDQKAPSQDEDLFLALCQQYAELATREADLSAHLPTDLGAADDEALDQLDDREAERRILLWRILNEANRGPDAERAGEEPAADLGPQDTGEPPASRVREAAQTRKGAFIEQLGSILRAPFRGANDRRAG